VTWCSSMQKLYLLLIHRFSQHFSKFRYSWKWRCRLLVINYKCFRTSCCICLQGSLFCIWHHIPENISQKVPYTLSVKLSDFTVWRHTWWKNWANCAVLTGNRAGFRTVLSSHLSYTELRSSFTESHSFLSLPAITMTASSQGTQQNSQKTDKPMGNLCCAREHSVQFFMHFFTQLNSTV
jgi:hypothetical protein